MSIYLTSMMQRMNALLHRNPYEHVVEDPEDIFRFPFQSLPPRVLGRIIKYLPQKENHKLPRIQLSWRYITVVKAGSLKLTSFPINDLQVHQVVNACSGIMNIYIADCKSITDKSLKHLSTLEKVVTFFLYSYNMTKQSLKYIARLPNLEFLTLSHCPNILDAHLGHFVAFKSLNRLKLLNCKSITDEGVKKFSSCRRLTLLDLSVDMDSSRITDIGITHLIALKNLKCLNLTGRNGVTPTGFLLLSELVHLENLKMEKCPQITRKNVTALQKEHVKKKWELQKKDFAQRLLQVFENECFLIPDLYCLLADYAIAVPHNTLKVTLDGDDERVEIIKSIFKEKN